MRVQTWSRLNKSKNFSKFFFFFFFWYIQTYLYKDFYNFGKHILHVHYCPGKCQINHNIDPAHTVPTTILNIRKKKVESATDEADTAVYAGVCLQTSM